MTEPVSLEYRDDVALIRIDNPPVNALGHAVRSGLLRSITEALASPAKAVVVAGAGKVFCAGADIREFGQGIAEPGYNDAFAPFDGATKPVVAAISGVALGGGLELALACNYRVAAADAKVGLPEVKLGILPGAGGTQRLPRLVGPKAAIDIMTSGDPLSAKAAKEAGILDAVIDGDLIEGAIAFARAQVGKAVSPVSQRGEKVAGIDPALFAAARADLAKKARNLFAPQRIVDAVEAACSKPFAEGKREEERLNDQCFSHPQSKALQHMFFAERDVWKVPGVTAATPARPIRKVAVIGAGTMGGGIAMNFVNAGIPVTLVEQEQAALDRGLDRIRGNYAVTVSKGKMTQEAMDARMALFTPTTELALVADADLVIEAVFERMDVKLGVFAKLDKIAKKGAVLGTNTSTLDINQIAASTSRPQDVVGLHFFSPANVMRLLEIVRGAQTAPDVLATALDMAKRIRKIAAVVGVCDGFVGNRMLNPYLREAEFLVAEGASPAEVDKALTDWGLAMGPFAMLDVAGNDVRWDVVKRMAADLKPGERFSNLVDDLGRMGRFGQKTGAGWYRYEPGSRAPIPDSSLEPLFEAEAKRQGIKRRTDITADEIVRRCLWGLVNEGADILQEGIALRGSDIDIVYCNGYGFPAWRGGPMHYADAVGLKSVVADIDGFRKTHGAHWQVSPLLRRLADEGRKLGGYVAE
jgi:3-hydroxyacyl-CoA dehydrogenase